MEHKTKDKKPHGKSNSIRMVDVSPKEITLRKASASARIMVSRKVFESVQSGAVPKGDVLNTACIAGIQAAKRTPELIPLCHPLAIDHVTIVINADEADASYIITASVTCHGKTGVEMEALTAASVAALTIYDMCKSIDKTIKITDIKLISKTGGKSTQ